MLYSSHKENKWRMLKSIAEKPAETLAQGVRISRGTEPVSLIESESPLD